MHCTLNKNVMPHNYKPVNKKHYTEQAVKDALKKKKGTWYMSFLFII